MTAPVGATGIGRRWRSPWWWVTGGVVGVFLAVNYRLVTGRALPRWDADFFFVPYFVLLADYARAGEWLLWNPWTNGGSPDFVDPQIGSFSPMVLLFGLLMGGSSSGFRAYWLSVWFVAALGILVLGRHVKAPAWGAGVVALGFVFSGFFVGNAEQVSFVSSLAWLPFMIWRMDVALESRRVRPALEAGALWGLSALAGYPGLVLLNGIVAVLWAAGRRWAPDASADRRGAPISIGTIAWTLGALFVVGLAVMSPAYAGMMVEGRGFTDRVGPISWHLAVEWNALHPRALATLFTPYVGNQWADPRWVYTAVSFVSMYMGAAVLWLALVALVARPREPWRWWLCGMALVAIAMSLGRTLPFRGWLYDLVPPFQYFRHPSMFRGYAIFCLTAVALLGARDLAGLGASRARWTGRLALATAVLVVVAVVAGQFALFGPTEKLGDLRRFKAIAHLWVVWAAIAGISVAVRIPRVRWRAALVPAALVALGIVDAVAAQRLPITLENTDREWLAEWRSRDEEHVESLDLVATGHPRVPAVFDVERHWTDNFNLLTKVPVLRGYAPLSNAFQKEWVGSPTLREAATGKARWWYAEQAPYVAASDAAMKAFVERTATLRAPVVVLHAREDLVRGPRPGQAAADASAATLIGTLPAAERVLVVVKTYRPNELTFDVTARAAGWLMVTDRWARGWRATVNGQAVPVEPAGFVFRAVPVREGQNAVRFTYHPFGFPWLLVLSWGTLASIGVFSVVGCWRARRQPRAGPVAEE